MEKGTLLSRALANAPDLNRYSKSVILVRVLVSFVFVSEGIQKFLFADALGVGRFIKIGIPAPEIMAPFVGVVEIVFGLAILLGLATRLSAVPLLIDICVAIASTKVPMLLHSGFWAMAHEARTDFAMLMGLVFLLLVGSGDWSIDRHFERRVGNPNHRGGGF